MYKVVYLFIHINKEYPHLKYNFKHLYILLWNQINYKITRLSMECDLNHKNNNSFHSISILASIIQFIELYLHKNYSYYKVVESHSHRSIDFTH